jgi:hypothetical protein
MQEQYPEIAASQKYPLNLVRSYWPDVPIGSIVSYMIAQALIEGVTHLGFWGIHFASGSEYGDQRANCEHWIGIARGMGVQIVIPKSSPLCHEPIDLYGYESHTPEKYAARKQRFMEAARKTAFSPAGLAPATPEALERAAAIRKEKDPAWCAEVATYGAKEQIPQELLDMEARERERAGLSEGAICLSVADGLPPSGAESQGAPGLPKGASGERGTTPRQGHGDLQSDVRALESRADRERRVQGGARSKGSKSVAGARRAAGQSRARKRAGKAR